MPRLSRLIAPMALFVGVLVAACAPNSGREARLPDTQRGPGLDPSQPVTVALLAPQTSSNQGAAQLGQAIVNSARLAQADINDPLLNLQIYDTGGSPGGAVSAANRALAEGAQLILGPLFSEGTAAIAGAAQARNVNIISFSTDSSVAGGPVFLSGYLPEMAARRITGFARSRGLDPLAIIYPETQYGSVALAGAEAGAGSSLIVRTSYPRTAEAIPSAAENFAGQVLGSGARGLVLAESGQGLQYLSALLADRGLGGADRRFLGLGEWDTRSTLETPELRGGWFASADPGALRAFVDRYRQRYGSVPPQLGHLGYDAVQIAAQLVDEARRNGGEPFGRDAITRAQGFRGAVGPIRFLPDGRGERGLAILEVGNGAFQVIDRAPSGFGAGS